MILDKFTEHATKRDIIKRMVLREQHKRGRQLKRDEVINLFNKRSVCPKCERFALRSEGWTKEKPIATCECGYSGPAMSVREYVSGGYYK